MIKSGVVDLSEVKRKVEAFIVVLDGHILCSIGLAHMKERRVLSSLNISLAGNVE